ncbi:MAG: DUF6382 domain-containing protein [Lachnospiraceae bacterium]|nr:DUF6382 domain-containing protein [Lachnospiraceae bacterium]
MNAIIRQENRKKYLLIKRERLDNDYRERMLKNNNISGVIKTRTENFNGEEFWSLEIGAMRSLTEKFDGGKMRYPELKNFFNGYAELLKMLDEYLLSDTELIYEPEYIYWDEDRNMPLFGYIPGKDSGDGEAALAEFLVEAADQKDLEAVKLAGQFFNDVCEGTVSLEKLIGKERSAITEIPIIKMPEFRGDERSIASGPEVNIRKIEYETPESGSMERAEKKNTRNGIIICALMTLLAAGCYAAVLFDPDILTALGFSEDDYLTAGAIIAVFFAVAMIAVIHLYKRRNAECEEKGIFENNEEQYREYRSDYLENAMQRQGAEIKAEKSYGTNYFQENEAGEETVLLNDCVRSSGELHLVGMVNGENVDLSVNDETYTIGKLQGRVQGFINDRSVSRIHACIRRNSGRYFLCDLNSTNGTCVNDRKLERDENAEICAGDIIKFAHVTMKVVV